jgi:hypothetical protein
MGLEKGGCCDLHCREYGSTCGWRQRLPWRRCWRAALRPLIRRWQSENVEPADTIVVLGGMMNPARGSLRLCRTSTCRRTGSVYAARLYRAGRVRPDHRVTGGRLFAGAACAQRSRTGQAAAAPSGGARGRHRTRDQGSQHPRERLVRPRAPATRWGLAGCCWSRRPGTCGGLTGVFGRLGIDVIPAATDSFLPQLSSGFPFGWLPDVDATGRLHPLHQGMDRPGCLSPPGLDLTMESAQDCCAAMPVRSGSIALAWLPWLVA